MNLFFSFFLFTCLFLFFPSLFVFATVPRLRAFLEDQDAGVSNDFKIMYYPQTLDHYNYQARSYALFNQKYVVNSKYWAGANSGAPIFAYLGAEAPIAQDYPYVGFLTENAPHFKALIVYLEHRFYGESIPFGLKFEEAVKNESLRGYFNSAQALADYAELLQHLKKKFSLETSPVIVFGGSYGGMLASWFRLKYPHVAHGALASSAPIIYFDKLTPQNGYHSIVTKDFKEYSQSCAQVIRASWDEIDKIGDSQPGGLSILSRRFKTCKKLRNTGELKDYLEMLYCTSAQYNDPPSYMFCDGIDGAPKNSDILDRVMAGLVSTIGNRTCYQMDTDESSSQTEVGFRWQTCSEMVIPIGRGPNDTMFQANPFNLTHFIEQCKMKYGVEPRPHWITTFYGGESIKKVLRKFGSNIIFSNGLRDPYSSGGILEDISDTIVAVKTVNGSHCQDIQGSMEDDPKWLKFQRKKELRIIKSWIEKY